MVKKLILSLSSGFYQKILKRIFFKIDPDVIHQRMVAHGEHMGKVQFVKKILDFFFCIKSNALVQEVKSIHFENPVGLSAGFDYEGRLTQITSSLGFGFHTVGTITKRSFEGNPRPQLGRLPKSHSLMVNKGFRNKGAAATAKKLSSLSFEIPIGISIGRTNDGSMTLNESIEDIISSFSIFEKERVRNSYYELNISCPNLEGGVSFYESAHLEKLLRGVDQLKLTKPIFIKMPISESNGAILRMMNIIVTHNIAGVIVGNLQKERKIPELDPEEVKKFPIGNFSGKATWNRSNELIELLYKKYKDKIIIIGCGGVFSAEDAYVKIKKGATLVQLITGMIFQGPQLISEINSGLVELLKKEGYTHISQVVGSDIKK